MAGGMHGLGVCMAGGCVCAGGGMHDWSHALPIQLASGQYPTGMLTSCDIYFVFAIAFECSRPIGNSAVYNFL